LEREFDARKSVELLKEGQTLLKVDKIEAVVYSFVG
jgi:hypothetical protein